MTEGRGRPPRPPRRTRADRRAERGQVNDPAQVLEAAARFLEARPRSESEVRHRLTDAGYPPELVEGAVSRLVEMGYLDDEAFASGWVESRDRARPRGVHALRRELQLKGVASGIIDAVLEERRAAAADAVTPDGADPDEAADPDDAAADRLLRRKLPALLREPDPRRRRQRAYALLARSGFAPDVCATVSRRVLAAEPDATDGEIAGT
jgi:SOS response regulatory protein OraA/RecX